MLASTHTAMCPINHKNKYIESFLIGQINKTVAGSMCFNKSNG